MSSPLPGPEPAAGPEDDEELEHEPWRLRDHIGILSGWLLALIFLAFLALLAAAGDPAALAILVVMIIGAAMIALGVKLRGR